VRGHFFFSKSPVATKLGLPPEFVADLWTLKKNRPTQRLHHLHILPFLPFFSPFFSLSSLSSLLSRNAYSIFATPTPSSFPNT
jgi:hypothetical protein